MRKSAVSFAVAMAFMGVADVARGGDMAVKATRMTKQDPCGNARFSGAYFGGNAGAIAYTATRTDPDGFLFSTAEHSVAKIGGTLGLQAGYDWQSCHKVFGLVADVNWAGAGAAEQLAAHFPAPRDISIHSKLDWFSTLRARAGIAVNDTLFYLTGGFAAARIETAITHRTNAINEKYQFDNTRWGLVGGVGAETSLFDKWSLTGEVLYMQFAKDTDSFRSPYFARNFNFENNDSAWIGRLGLNYRFDNPRGAYASGHAPMTGPCGPARFSGGYIGGNAGAVSYTALRQDREGFLSEDVGNYSATRTGFTAGAQIGWDWQSCNRLLGVVADWNWADTDAKVQLDPNNPSILEGSARAELGWFGTVRARAGLAVDDALIYVTGGVAAARISSTLTMRQPPLSDQQVGYQDTRWGLAAGVGAEFALGDQWSVNAELLYLQFAKAEDTIFATAVSVDKTVGSQDSAWVSRVGLNYRWDNARAAQAAIPHAQVSSSCGPARFGGFHAGGHVGGLYRSSLTLDQNGYFNNSGDSAQYTATKGGASAGVQAGYDWQSCRKLFGVVADINWTDADTTSRINPNSAADRAIRSDMSGFATLRARSGLAMDDMLIYVTGGVAAARISSTINDTDGVIREQFSSKDTRWGWAGGAGAEFALAGGWSVNGELLYLQFRKEQESFQSPLYGAVYSFEHQDSAWIGRVGLNYRWGDALTAVRN